MCLFVFTPFKGYKQILPSQKQIKISDSFLNGSFSNGHDCNPVTDTAPSAAKMEDSYLLPQEGARQLTTMILILAC